MSEAARPSLWPEEAFYPLRALVTVIQPTDATWPSPQDLFQRSQSGIRMPYCRLWIHSAPETHVQEIYPAE